MVTHPTHRSSRYSPELYLIVGSVAGFLSLTRESWRIWTTRVTVDETGLRWTKGFVNEALRWDEISELGYRHEGRRGTRLIVGPVRARSKFLHPLPILPRELYDVLKVRIGGLPPKIEEELYKG